MAYKFNVISADSHFTITNDRLLAQLPRTHHEAAHEFLGPRTGGKIGSSGTDQTVRESWMWPALGRVGQRDPAERLKDMDADGIDVEVLYTQGDAYSMPAGDPPAIDGAALLGIPDVGLRVAMTTAYNSAMQEWIEADPTRLIPVGLIPIVPVDEAVKEMRRLKGLGFRTIRIPGEPPKDQPPYWHEQWDPIWATAQELGLPIALHVGGSRSLDHIDDPTPGKQFFKSLPPMAMSHIVGGFILVGPLNRFPELKIVLVESGIGWIPYYLERMDMQWGRHGFRNRGIARTDEPPSEMWRRHFFATFEEDVAGVKLIDELGANQIMWASDYPHPDSTWPESRKVIENHFSKISAEQRHLVVFENARRLYGLPAA